MIELPLESTEMRTERVTTYVELPLLKMFESYAAKGGFRSVSEVLRRLAIIGLDTERQAESAKRAADDGVKYEDEDDQ